jgi:small GTP-binding protein
VRRVLSSDFSEIQAMLDKLENSHIHIAVFGRVGVGKSALLNALLGERRFSTSPLHGETRRAQSAAWEEWEEGGVFLIDTPGINDVEGEERERHTRAAVNRSDLILFVVDGDLSSTEFTALKKLLAEHRPVVLVLNKADLYTLQDKRLLLQQLKTRTAGLIPDSRIVVSAASPADRVYLQVDDKGKESMTTRATPPVVDELRYTLWSILENEGKTLAALNATLFAGKLSDAVNQRIITIKKDLAEKLIRNYCILKGAVVGLNPIPISDLVAAGAVDVSLVLHLGRIYGLPIDYSEAGKLIRTIGAQMVLIMGSVWAVHFIASALKGGTAGLSTVLTAATQGAVAYYSAYVVGETAQTYFAQGRSWGPKGPKRVVQDILDNLDRDSLLADARQQILARLRAG